MEQILFSVVGLILGSLIGYLLRMVGFPFKKESNINVESLLNKGRASRKQLKKVGISKHLE